MTGVQIAADSAAELHQMHFHEATVNLMETSTARFTGLTTWVSRRPSEWIVWGSLKSAT